ncbi:chaplin [Actinacidiphila acidipaludis]|uniref:Chaplin n=1 Tax=Actinacidiphila acidipaludis TaxID=2873382 RepID=A0ABS7QBI2_9ACTN|nr:chaplin [Streptomyces acidipaludis]MBY8880467.1 chaplin [Streptomyces acidipaludis]
MRQVARKGLLTVVATGGALAATGGLAHADAGAAGTADGSPGVVSGNAVQLPVHVPVNLCGDTVNVIGALNPALGNHCADVSSGGSGPSAHGGGSVATGHTGGSAGVGSGNLIQAPVDIPANVCGVGVDVVALLNPTFGDACGVDEGNPATPGTPSTPAGPGTPDTPGTTGTPATPDSPQTGTPDTNTVRETGTRTAALAETGSEGLGLTAALAGALLLGGAVLYRRGQAARR